MTPLKNGQVALFIDLDSTLLGKNGSLLRLQNGRFSLSAARFIVNLKKLNVRIILVSSRSLDQLHEISRLIGGADLICEMGRFIRIETTGELVNLTVDDNENPKFLYEKGKLDFLFDEFEGLLELHKPWHLNLSTTLLLRGCLKGKKGILLEEINMRLLGSKFSFLRLCDNGATLRSEKLLCKNNRRIYHLINKKQSKLNGVKEYLKRSGTRFSKMIAAGDSPSDLELSILVDSFFFAGNKKDFSLTEKLMISQNLNNIYFLKEYEEKRGRIAVGGQAPLLFKKILNSIGG
jgi:predicted mannosyl-3-phosphoglycerate phosphatase (HAD superfamily)